MNTPTTADPDPVLAVLKGARALLEPEGAWCQRAMARTAAGSWLMSPFDPHAARFCLLGALNRAHGTYLRDEIFREVSAALSIDPQYLPVWNDAPGRRRTKVLVRLDAAIAARESSS